MKKKIEHHIKEAPTETKIRLLDSMFPEKLVFDGRNYRTAGMNSLVDLIHCQTKILRQGRNEIEGKSFDLSSSVPIEVLYSNNFMDDLDKLWRLKAVIPDPTTPPILFRNPDNDTVYEGSD